jgi:hypothetical protein
MLILIVGIGALGGTIAACHPHRTARAACGSQYRFCGGIAQIGPRVCRRFGGGNAVIRQPLDS